MINDGKSWLVNRRTGKHIGPFTTGLDALFARTIAEDSANWNAMSATEFDTYLTEA